MSCKFTGLVVSVHCHVLTSSFNLVFLNKSKKDKNALGLSVLSTADPGLRAVGPPVTSVADLWSGFPIPQYHCPLAITELQCLMRKAHVYEKLSRCITAWMQSGRQTYQWLEVSCPMPKQLHHHST